MMEKRACGVLRKAYRDASGQSILESLLCSIILCILLVGLLQIFHLTVAKLLTDYSAFRTARSYCVGFRDYLQERSARVGAIGASGKIISPDNGAFADPMAQFAAEELMIPEYISGTRWLEYEYWQGENQYDAAYFDSATPPQTHISDSHSLNAQGSVVMNVVFTDYPFPFFDLFDKNRVVFDSVGKSTDVVGSSRLMNHASSYLAGGGEE